MKPVGRYRTKGLYDASPKVELMVERGGAPSAIPDALKLQLRKRVLPATVIDHMEEKPTDT